MAGRTRRVDLDQQRIAIAVGPKLLDLLHVAARRALVPELLAAAAPKPRGTGLERQPHRLLVHPGNHKHLAGVILLNHTRNQPTGVVRKIRRFYYLSHHFSQATNEIPQVGEGCPGARDSERQARRRVLKYARWVGARRSGAWASRSAKSPASQGCPATPYTPSPGEC